jgi:hypothetical protein
MKISILIGAGLLLLTACESQRPIAPVVPRIEPSALESEERQIAERDRAEALRQARLQEYRIKCNGYTLVEGTREFANCVQSEWQVSDRITRETEVNRREEAIKNAALENQRHQDQMKANEARRQQSEDRDRRERLAYKDEKQCPHAKQNVSGCVLYEHANFGGACLMMRAGESLESLNKFNNRTSSLRIDKRCRLSAFDEAEFKGKNWVLNTDAAVLPNEQNDKFSSVVCDCR